MHTKNLFNISKEFSIENSKNINKNKKTKNFFLNKKIVKTQFFEKSQKFDS